MIPGGSGNEVQALSEFVTHPEVIRLHTRVGLVFFIRTGGNAYDIDCNITSYSELGEPGVDIASVADAAHAQAILDARCRRGPSWLRCRSRQRASHRGPRMPWTNESEGARESRRGRLAVVGVGTRVVQLGGISDPTAVIVARGVGVRPARS